MKRFLFIAAATLVGLSLVGCSYDDSAIWDAMDELKIMKLLGHPLEKYGPL